MADDEEGFCEELIGGCVAKKTKVMTRTQIDYHEFDLRISFLLSQFLTSSSLSLFSAWVLMFQVEGSGDQRFLPGEGRR